MNAFRPMMDAQSAASREIRVGVVADRAVEREQIATLVCMARHSRPTLAYCGDLAAFRAKGIAPSIDAAIVVVGDKPGEIFKAQINILTRSTAVVLVGDADVVMSLTAPDGARARACLSREELTAGSLEMALSALLSARASEDRLLQVIASQNGQIQQTRSAGGRLAREIDSVVEAFGALAQDKSRPAQGDRALALATDALDSLACAFGEFERSTKGLAAQPTLLSSANLNSVLESFVKNLSGTGASKVSVLTSSNPIFVRADGPSIWRLLDRIVQKWREGRGPLDHLELLCWDAGADAKLAAVFSMPDKTFVAAGAPQLDSARPQKFLQQLCQHLESFTEICGAGMEINAHTGASTTLTLTLSLPKRPNTAVYPLTGRVSALQEALGASL